MEHKKSFCCYRLPLYNWLSERGFTPFSVKPDMKNPKFKVWLYDNTEEIRQCVQEYKDTLNK